MDSLPAAWRPFLTLLVVVLAGWLVHALAPILTPFLLAAALAYLFDPLVEKLGKHGVNRTAGTVLVMLTLLLAFVLIGLILTPLIQAEARLFMRQLPRLMEWGAQTVLPWFAQTFGVDLARDQEEVLAWAREHIAELSQLARYLPRLADGGLFILGLLANVLLVPVVTFYLLRDWPRVMAHLADWIPDRFRARTTGILGEIDVVLSEFVRGQVLVMLVMAAFYSLTLWLAGLDYALAVGVVSGVLVFVPYLGVVVGVLLGTLAGLAQFGELAGLIPVWLVFAFGQLLEGMLVTPWLVGERVGLHPVAVIFALMAFGQLFGFIGILIAIPAAAATLVAARHLKRELD
jgi:predicted PurR-regulated permease PerM